MKSKGNRRRGIDRARSMRRWADKQGGQAAAPDGFDRRDAGTLASLVDTWLARLETRAYSPRTVAARVWALRSFLTWGEARGLSRPAEIDKPVLEAFQRWLWAYRKENDGQPLAVATQRGHLGALQAFFAWACRENLLPANPAADLDLPRKQPRSLPRALSLAEVETILAVPDIADPLGVRDRAILETLYGTAVRRRELVSLDVGDVDRARGVVLVRGKGGKDRLAPLGAQAFAWIERYLAECRPLLEVSASEHALFLSGYGGRLNPNYLGNWVARVIKAAKIDKTGSCHLFRHACATHLLDNGADLRMIQELLGHARLDTTQIYTHVSIAQLREVHARCHPRGQA